MDYLTLHQDLGLIWFAAVPLWAWLGGAGLIGSAVVIDQAGDAAEQTGEALSKGTRFAAVVAIAAVAIVYLRKKK
jgi:uncharacterized membrane protein YdcZ (DUF606 family)